MSHARLTLLGVGKDESLLEAHLQDARKQIGNGMASIQMRMERSSFASAIKKSTEQNPVDLVIVGWRPMEEVNFAEQILQAGEHHLLLAAHPRARLEKALVCAASGEPGKDDVMFAGRLLRHLGAQAKLLTVIKAENDTEYQRQQIERFMAGGQHSLEMFGVPTQSEIRVGQPPTEIIAEMRSGEIDLIVLGAPLPDRDGRITLTKIVEAVMKNAGDCSLLIVRSHYFKKPIDAID
jgi:nucleotide-binding universal stress UspA family protein